MFGRDEQAERSRSAATRLALLAVLALRAAAARAQDRLEPLANGGTPAESVLRDVVVAAESKLAGSSCRQVFGDFRDLRGKRLQDTLTALGQTGQTFFRGLVFYEGYGRSACDSRATIAFTFPGSRAVFVCSMHLADMEHRDRGLAAALLIHEELHALGLGENPPSSREITARVIARCGK